MYSDLLAIESLASDLIFEIFIISRFGLPEFSERGRAALNTHY